MTSDPNQPRRGWERAWVLWAASAARLLVVAALVAVGLGAGRAATAAPDADAVPAGMNQATADLLGVTPVPTDPVTAPPYRLTDQYGRSIDSASLRGKSVVLTFEDDECTDLCVMLADDIVAADRDLPATVRRNVEFVSINANPYYPAPSDVKDWSDRNGLDALPNWEFLTGAPARLVALAQAYEVPVELHQATRTISHGSQIFVIDANGRIVEQAAFGTESADTAPFAHGLAALADDALPAAQRGHIAGANLANTIPAGTDLGDTPVPVTGPALDGTGELSSASSRGKLTVLDFWSSTCAACTTQLSDDAAEARSVGHAVAFLGVDVGDPIAAGRAMAARSHLGFATVGDAQGTQAARFRVSELPYTVILSTTGKVLLRHPGLFTTEELDYVLHSLDASLPGA